MSAIAAAVHLPRFASGAVPEIARAGFRRLNEKPEAAPEVDREAAENAAVAAALAAQQAEFDAARAADQADFQQRLAERENEILASVGEALSAEILAGLAAIEERVGDQVGTVLMHFLGNAVRERAVSELGEAVAALFTGATATRVRIAGPAVLCDRVAAAVAEAGVPVERADQATAEVSVTIDDTIVETNVSAWMDRLMAEVGTADDG